MINIVSDSYIKVTWLLTWTVLSITCLGRSTITGTGAASISWGWIGTGSGSALGPRPTSYRAGSPGTPKRPVTVYYSNDERNVSAIYRFARSLLYELDPK